MMIDLDRQKVKTDKLFKKIKEAALAIIIVKVVFCIFQKALGLSFCHQCEQVYIEIVR